MGTETRVHVNADIAAWLKAAIEDDISEEGGARLLGIRTISAAIERGLILVHTAAREAHAKHNAVVAPKGDGVV